MTALGTRGKAGDNPKKFKFQNQSRIRRETAQKLLEPMTVEIKTPKFGICVCLKRSKSELLRNAEGVEKNRTKSGKLTVSVKGLDVSYERNLK